MRSAAVAYPSAMPDARPLLLQTIYVQGDPSRMLRPNFVVYLNFDFWSIYDVYSNTTRPHIEKTSSFHQYLEP